jgi:DNA-binding NarL/FixJ family response regulator
MALTERERQVLQLHAEGLSDYRIARKLKMETPNVTRSRKNALKKLECAKADIEFIDNIKASYNARSREKRNSLSNIESHR